MIKAFCDNIIEGFLTLEYFSCFNVFSFEHILRYYEVIDSCTLNNYN